jgi:hypothetical protein
MAFALVHCGRNRESPIANYKPYCTFQILDSLLPSWLQRPPPPSPISHSTNLNTFVLSWAIGVGGLYWPWVEWVNEWLAGGAKPLLRLLVIIISTFSHILQKLTISQQNCLKL